MRRRRHLRHALTAGMALLGALAAADAQPPQPAAPGGRGRPAVEQLARVVQRRLALTDAQAARLRESTARFAGARELVRRDEGVARSAIRTEIARGDAADQQRVARALDDLLRLQRRRAEVAAAEQGELAAFLTPVQRARYLAMQERAFRTAHQMRRGRELRGGRRPPP